MFRLKRVAEDANHLSVSVNNPTLDTDNCWIVDVGTGDTAPK